MDGVLRHWDLGRAGMAEDAAGVAMGSLAAACSLPEYEAAVLGEVSFDAWGSATVDALALAWG